MSDFRCWRMFGLDDEENERDSEFVPGKLMYTRGKLYDTHLHRL